MNLAAQNLLAFAIGVGFLIFVHEAGHFLVAKFFGVRVLVFSFGFGKRLAGFRKGDTDYRLSLIPLGGYVRMAGDSQEENVAGAPDEFLSKPKWQRFLILFAGPSMNLVIAISFIAMLAMFGIQQRVSTTVVGQVEAKSAAEKAGLQTGDRILRIKGEAVQDFDDIKLIVSMNAGTPLKVVYVRNGQTRETTLTPEKTAGDYGPIGRAGFGIWTSPVVAGVAPKTPAAVAGLRAGDRIVRVEGKPVASLEDFGRVSEEREKKPVTVDVVRGTETLHLTIQPSADEDLRFSRGILAQTKTIKLSLLPALNYSVNENWRMLRLSMSALGRLFRTEGSMQELSGPINIARISGDMWRQGTLPFLALLAMISLQLGVMNLLPIPVLDGGHIMILLLEGIARRDFSIRAKERIQQAGFAVLATLMIVVLFNDVVSNVLRLKNG
jgi:regulator of sigma E protease